MENLKVAVIADWLVSYAGSEQVLEQIIKIFPQADLFCVVNFLSKHDQQRLGAKSITPSFIQRLPFARKKYRQYLPLMPLAVEQFDLSAYNLIISSSHAVAKGVLTGPDQLHIAYIHSPIRYAWDLQHQYLKEANLTRGIKSFFSRSILHYMRLWDSRTVNSVDCLIANSKFIARRIKKVYRRESTVIYPPVDTQQYNLQTKKENFYFTASRMVPYKKINMIIEAFNQMPDKQLIISGDGPDFKKNQRLAKNQNIKFLGYTPSHELKKYMQAAKAFVFAAEEDFGIVTVEAQACGTPVIAYNKGGSTETVLSGKTGIFFDEQNITSLINAVKDFERQQEHFSPADIQEHALNFSVEIFHRKFTEFVIKQWEKWKLPHHSI